MTKIVVMKSKGVRVISIEDVENELDFCSWIQREFSRSNIGIDIDHANLDGTEAFVILKKIREREKLLSTKEKRVFTRIHSEGTATP